MKQDNRSPGLIVNGLKQVYAILLRAYPGPFRQTFAVEMVEVFSDQVDEEARRGMLPLLWLAARELWHTIGAILRAYWRNPSRTCSLLWRLLVRFINVLFAPEPPGGPEKPSSWWQTAREAALLAILGSGLIISTYLPAAGGKPGTDWLAAFVLVMPILWLLVGLARGMPGWAYPSLGMLLGYGILASQVKGAGPLMIFLLLISLALLMWAYRVNRTRPFLPAVFRTWGESLSKDSTRLSFGGYGFLAIAIIVAFDNAYANHHTAWFFVSVLSMLGGAAAYSRGRAPAVKLSALAAGATFSLLAALLDHARFAALHWPGPTWIYGLWISLLILVFLPPAALGVMRFIHTRAGWARPSPGG
jgi:hypothetical protein